MKRFYLMGIILVFLASACSQGGAANRAETPMATGTPSPPPTGTPTLTPTATIAPPDTLPEAGYSNVYGRVLLKGEPVKFVSVSLIVPRPGEPIYHEEAETDSSGRFLFTQVPASEYGQLMIFEEDLKTTFGEERAEVIDAIPVDFPVPADTNYNFGEYYIIESNLTLLHPVDRVELDASAGMLEWEAYPGAMYYHVNLNQWIGTYTDLEAETQETQLELLPLMDCQYTWSVAAYDAEGNPLANSSDAAGMFTIKNDMLPSCKLRIISPEHMEDVTGRSFKMEWELHPLATRYDIQIMKHFGYIDADIEWYRGRVMVNEDGSLSAPDPSIPRFEADAYHLIIKAYTADGGFVASGARSFFIP